MKKTLKLLVTAFALISTTIATANSLEQGTEAIKGIQKKIMQEVLRDVFMLIKNKENKWDYIGH